MRVTDKHVLFWGEEFSNFHPAPIHYEENGIKYFFPTSEHMFMWQKARYFRDEISANAILNVEHPRDAKKIGRKVSNFDNEEWAKVRYERMLRAVTLKFKQNPDLKAVLLSDEYKDKHFVEASPFDEIWGIGYDENHVFADDETKWKGLNLLGKCLDEVRDNLIKEESNDN
jgi:ribA/ribD-fused uncharacterized protein